MLSNAAQEFQAKFKVAQAKAQGVDLNAELAAGKEVPVITDPRRLLGPGVVLTEPNPPAAETEEL